MPALKLFIQGYNSEFKHFAQTIEQNSLLTLGKRRWPLSIQKGMSSRCHVKPSSIKYGETRIPENIKKNTVEAFWNSSQT